MMENVSFGQTSKAKQSKPNANPTQPNQTYFCKSAELILAGAAVAKRWYVIVAPFFSDLPMNLNADPIAPPTACIASPAVVASDDDDDDDEDGKELEL